MKILDSVMKDIQHIETDGLHMIYAGHMYVSEHSPFDLNPFIFDMMKKYKIKSWIFTIISMFKNRLVTKEVMADYYKGRFKDENDFDKASVHDDLETFFEGINLENDIESVVPPPLGMFCLPKLTEEELILVKNKDEEYLRGFGEFHGTGNPDVDEHEMKLSESKSKFAYCMCLRISSRFTL